MAMTEAQKRANKKYDSANTKRYCFKFNKNTDTDILAKLDSVDNKLAYIKSLIRKDLSENS